jgi:AraC-like DNA-binding protein
MPAAKRVIRHENESGRWALALRAPDLRLRAEVLVLEDYDERMAGPVRRRHLPAGFVPLILNTGPPYRLLDAADPAVSAEYGSFTAGLGESSAVSESSGTARCVQVNLTPLGAYRLLGVPMHELTDRVVPLADVFGGPAERLEERLANASGSDARLAIVESFLLVRLAEAAPARPDVAYAWRRLAETGGRLRIGALAAELGCSRKHLASRFRDHVGLPPKAVARLLRFNRALRFLEGGLQAAEVAYRCGYTDQAHFVNEFRRFSGSTPGAFARTPEVPFLQDADARAA